MCVDQHHGSGSTERIGQDLLAKEINSLAECCGTDDTGPRGREGRARVMGVPVEKFGDSVLTYEIQLNFVCNGSYCGKVLEYHAAAVNDDGWR